ncbi:MAG: dual specificity protein phosphatase family protein, partial [Gammaproteobacteria bacterium]|nr:dual specificity protein phosphatase family protein [Gammaproteobacteria bacterium]
DVSMKHIFWLIDGELCGRAGPNHQPWNAQELKAAGVGAVLSVNNADAVYPDEFDSAGISYRCIPLASNAPPRPGDLELCVERLALAYSYARSEIEAGRALLVHCRHGKDRTALFMAHYLKMQRKLGTREAIAVVKAVRPIALTATGWDRFAIDVLDAGDAAF